MIRVAAAVIRKGASILLTQRPEGASSPLQWEFPGGKIERGETPSQALAREIREELGVEARVGKLLATVSHVATGVEIHFLVCELDSEAFVPAPAVRALRWVDPKDVDPEELLAADRGFLRSLRLSGRPRE